MQQGLWTFGTVVLCGYLCSGLLIAEEPPQLPGKKANPNNQAQRSPEALLMAQFKAFAIRKRDYIKQLSKENDLLLPPVVNEFFDAAIASKFAQAQKHYKIILQIRGLSVDEPFPAPKKMRESVQKSFAPIQEVLGGMETVDSWHAKFLHFYTKEIVSSIPKGSIYFGGTDPGRFAITMGCSSHTKANPFFTVTQNALADGTYLQYLRELYGKRIHIPSSKDNQAAFTDYMEQAKRRMFAATLGRDEQISLFYTFQCPTKNCVVSTNVTINATEHVRLKQLEKEKGLPCKICGKLMRQMEEPRVSISGTGAIMGVNAFLAKTLFEKNPDHKFYLEESFALDWMKPHMIPHGLIFKLERKPFKELRPEHLAQSRKDWQKYMAFCVGDSVVKPETTVAKLCKWVEAIYIKGDRGDFKGDALYLKGKKEVMEKSPFQKGAPFNEQKTFSKMRSDQASLFAWRLANTKDEKLKKEYAREADFAYRQAFALGPINPEVAFRYVAFLNNQARFEDAKMIARVLVKIYPNQNKAWGQNLMLRILTHEEIHWAKKQAFKKALSAALAQAKLNLGRPGLHGIQQRIQSYRKLIEQNEPR